MIDVFSRPECIWNYCPHPNQCQLLCSHEREDFERELDADDEVLVRASWIAIRDDISFAEALAIVKADS